MSNRERRLFSLLGHPVRQSVSPVMYSAAFRALGMPHVYSAFDVPTQDELVGFVGDLRGGLISGANVTAPYKRHVLSLTDEVDQGAKEIGAANVLYRTSSRQVVAHNTDVDALQDDLDDFLQQTSPLVVGAQMRQLPPNPRLCAVIIGAGGTGLAAVAACKNLGFKVISITTRSWISTEIMFDSPAAELARALGALVSPWPASTEPSSFKRSSLVLRMNWIDSAVNADLIIQATSSGMLGGSTGDDVAAIVPWDKLQAHAHVYDVVYNPPVTPFLRLARMRGLRARDGLGMLVGQAARSFTLWTGFDAPVDIMRTAAEESLEKAASVR